MRRSALRWGVCATLAIGVALHLDLCLHAQGKARFEAVVVKPSRTDSQTMLSQSRVSPNGRFQGSSVTVAELVATAYGVRAGQVVTDTHWLTHERFDVLATAGALPAPDVMREMLQQLLADEFGLVLHRETRAVPAYELRLERADTLGPILKTSAHDCAGRRDVAATAERQVVRDDVISCGIRVENGLIIVGGLPLSQLATALERLLGRSVTDATDLGGAFSFRLIWRSSTQVLPDGVGDNPAEMTLPSLEVALREQLGLRLISKRKDETVLVIDRATKPTH